MTRENRIGEIRPVSTFETYKPQTPEQQFALDGINNLSQELINNRERIANEDYPFDYAMWVMLWGKPGTGKTHLLEAFANKLKLDAPEVAEKVFFSRSKFAHDNGSFAASYDEKPIVIIDDMFADTDAVENLNSHTDIQAIANFVRATYERRRLVLSSCNFPFQGRLLDKIRAVDQTGRLVISSSSKYRFANLLADL